VKDGLMRLSLACCAGLLCALTAASPAWGQPSIEVWLEGRYFQDQDRTRDHVVRSGPGGGAAVGLDFSRRWGMQIALDWPAAHVETIQTISPTRSGSFRRSETVENSAPSVSVLAAFHALTTDRVRLTVLGGLGRYQTPMRMHSVLEEVAADGRVLSRTEFEDTDNYPKKGLALGAEVVVRIAGGLSVVPAVHAILLPLADYGRIGVVRPGVGVRFRF
jgi:hypothetical protein